MGLDFLVANAPPSVLAHLTSHSAMYFRIFQSWARLLQQTTQLITKVMTPLLARLIANPDIASILLLVVLLVVGIQVVGIAYRAIMWWIRLAFKLTLLAVILVAGAWISSRGLEGTAADIDMAGRMVTREYRRWQGVADQYQYQRGYGVGDGGGGFMRGLGLSPTGEHAPPRRGLWN